MIDRLYGIQSQDIAWFNGRIGKESHLTDASLGLQKLYALAKGVRLASRELWYTADMSHRHESVNSWRDLRSSTPPIRKAVERVMR